MRNIYIIGVTHTTDGIAAIVKHTLSHIIYANKNNLIPIVDLKHYKNPYYKDLREFKDNIWEYYFQQPNGLTLDDISDDDNVILSKNTFLPDKRYSFPVSMLPIYPKRWEPNSLVDEYKKYLVFNKEMQIYLENGLKEKIGDKRNILGILCRGTDYHSLKPYCHPIQPSPEIVINKAKELLKKINYEKIYLATEDDQIYNRFLSEFGDMMIPNTQYKYDKIPLKRYLTQIKTDRKNHHYTLAKEYLLSLYILSSCKYFIGGRTSGTSLVYLMTKGFDYEYIWSLGYYDVRYKLKEYFFSWLSRFFRG